MALAVPAVDAARPLWRPSLVKLDLLNRENLETVLSRHDADFGAIPAGELENLNRAWEQLDPWPDSVEGLTRLKRRYAIGPLSNGHIAGMLNLARSAGLPWDVITGAEVTKSYKPMPQAYLKSADAVGLPPERVSMVAAHNEDLQGAHAAGLRTIFVRRPHEHGPGQTTDLEAGSDWDVAAESLTDVADQLGCP